MKPHPMFPDADQARAAALADAIGKRMIFAVAPLGVEMAQTEDLHPQTMTMAIVECHLMGAAASITAAADGGMTSTTDRAALARMVAERVERLMNALDRTAGG